jgi:tRNA dimethylallyltransferase
LVALSKKRKVIFIQGGTASGKSAWALKMAQKFSGAIVNCDSIQVYKDLDIGSAKPSVAERAMVPHFLYDFVNPPHEYTAGMYQRDFNKLLEEINEQYIFVVGGTGFYFQAIEKGMYPVRPVNEEILRQVQAEIKLSDGAAKLYQELQRQDPDYASKISVNDHYRIERAVVLLRTEGKTVTQIRSEFSAKIFAHPLLKIGVQKPKDLWRSDVEKRTKQMLDSGLIEEVQSILERGLESWAPMSSVGYKEVVHYLRQGGSLPDLAAEISQNTMKLIKKQKTWFQRDSEINWYSAEQMALGLSKVEEFLASS